MTWCVDDEEAWNLKIEFFSVLHNCNMILKVFFREVSGTDLLSDSTGFVSLDIGFSEFIKNKCLARVDVTHDTDDGTAQLLCSASFTIFLLSCL